MAGVNALFPKPDYVTHRVLTGAPVVADNSDLTVLGDSLRPSAGEKIRGAIHTRGYKSVHGFVKLTGGTNITLNPLGVAQYRDNDGLGDEVDELIDDGSAIVVSDGGEFSITTNGALLFVRVGTVTGAVTRAEIYLAGAERDLEGVGCR